MSFGWPDLPVAAQPLPQLLLIQPQNVQLDFLKTRCRKITCTVVFIIRVQLVCWLLFTESQGQQQPHFKSLQAQMCFAYPLSHRALQGFSPCQLSRNFTTRSSPGRGNTSPPDIGLVFFL